MSEVFTRAETILGWNQVTTTTAAALVTSLTNAPPVSQFQQGLQLTNDSAANTIYFGYDNTVTATKFVFSIAPGAQYPPNGAVFQCGRAVYGKLWAISPGGNTLLSVAVVQ